MYVLCDEKRVFLHTDYRVEAYDKEALVKGEKMKLLWKSEKLSKNLGKLVNAKDHLYGIGADLVAKISKVDGTVETFTLPEDLIDLFCTYSGIYLLGKTGLFRMPLERFSPAEIKRSPVSHLMEKPFSCLCASDDSIYVASRSQIYRIDKEGGKVNEKALTEVCMMLISEEGPIAIRKDGKILNMDENMEVLSTGEFDGEPIKAEYNVHHTFLLTSTGLHIFGKTGGRIAHISDSKYLSFSEGLNHVYLYKENGFEVASKADILGDNYQKVDLATVSAIVFTSLMLFEREKGVKVNIRERYGLLDIRVDDQSIQVEKLFFRLSKYFPEVFILFSNSGYYESLMEFGQRFELIKKQERNITLNRDLLDHLLRKHSAFEAFREDIIHLVSSCLS